MAKSDLRFVLEHLRRALPVAGLTDGELLGRFVAGRDEAAFEALVHLEGRSHQEVARLLGVPEGTLASRLVKARRLLAGRLGRCGVSLSGASLVSVLAEGVAPAAVAPPLVAVTVRAATLFGAGQ